MTAPARDLGYDARWPLSHLRPNQKNPRAPVTRESPGIAELTDSIREQGILQPLLITPAGVVVAGHRRLVAAKLAGLTEAPVIMRDLSDDDQVELMLIENLQREDLSFLEEARAYKRLLDKGRTQAEVARKTGISTARIAARLQLLELDSYVQEMFDRGELPMSIVPVLLRIPVRERQRQVALQAARQQLTVAQIKQIVEKAAGVLATPAPLVKSPPTNPHLPKPREIPLANTPGRKEVLERMDQQSGKTVSVAMLAEHFQKVCCSCGMSDLPAYCSACPMVQLVDAVLGGAAA
jgi:ParB family transcriptional regulator, chromosome partitioning protein